VSGTGDAVKGTQRDPHGQRPSEGGDQHSKQAYCLDHEIQPQHGVANIGEGQCDNERLPRDGSTRDDGSIFAELSSEIHCGGLISGAELRKHIELSFGERDR